MRSSDGFGFWTVIKPKCNGSECSKTYQLYKVRNEIRTVGDRMKKAILVVSFGTSYEETRKKTIEAIEKRIDESFEEYKPAVSVGERMEELYRYSLLVDKDSECAVSDIIKGHSYQRIASFVLYLRCVCYLLEVVPKCASFQLYRNGGESSYCYVQGRL